MKVFRPTIPPTAKPQIANPSGPAAQPMLAACCRWEGTDIILSVKVYPRSGKFGLCRVVGNALRVKVAAPPEAGRATEELLVELAQKFGVRPSGVTLIHGAFTPQKVIRITSPKKLPPELIA